MAFLLLVPPILAWLAARRLLGERDALGASAMVLPLGLSLLLLGVNGVYRVADLQQAVLGTVGVIALAALLIALLTRPQPLQKPRLHPATLAFLVVAGLAIYLFTNSQQVANPDDDYWIHTPLQGLMLHGGFPPTNPFFSDIPMNGHYGRNLMLVSVGWLSGLDMPFVQVLMTDVFQLATFLLLFTTLRRATGSELQAVLGTAFMFFGINVGGRGGVMDTLQNNNAVVHMDLVLILNLVLRVWGGPTSGGRFWAAVLGGLVLGGYAIVYETHFGLVLLATLSTAAVVCGLQAWKGPRTPTAEGGGHADRLDRRALALTLLLLALATPLAVTQGGPLTELFHRKVLGQAEVDVATLSKGMQNQAQFVKVQFPKERLFQILLEHGEYQRISYVYRTRTFLSRFYSESPERGYRYIWSWDVLKIHWLALLLAPFSAWVLLRRRHLAGLWLGAFGLVSFLIPAVVDFGPVYESEYFRWQFAAGLGLAGALGLAAGALFEDFWRAHPGALGAWQPTPSEARLRLGPRGLAVLALVLVAWLETLSCGEFLLLRMEDLTSKGQWVRGALLLPDTRAWLARHAVLDFHPADWEAARWLEKRVQPRQRMLSNFQEENNFSILYESTLSGLSGARSVGHALPLDDEPIGTTPYHMAPPARAFWSTLDPGLLRGLGADWLYVREDVGQTEISARLAGLPGLKLQHQAQDPHSGRRLLYRVELPPLAAGLVAEGVSPVEVQALELPQHLRNGRGYRARLTVRNSGAETLRLRDGVLFYETVRRSTGKRTAEVERILQPLDLELPLGQSRTLEIPFVAPHEDGDYDLEFFLGDSREVRRLGGLPQAVRMDFRPRLAALSVKSWEPLDKPWPGRLVRLCAGLENPTDRPLLAQDGLLAAVLAVRPEPGAERLAAQELQPVSLHVPAGGRADLEVVARMPERPGQYRLDLVLVPIEGGAAFLEGPLLEVGP